MRKVITYGTFDLMHYGHIRLLERAKSLGDYLVVGVTSDDFDKSRGKLNVQQGLSERLEAVKNLGIADEVIVEEYEGQKIDDILKYGISIFTVGSDWKGKFDYLKEYCDVIYLDRTEGVSSSEIRTKERQIRFGLVGESVSLEKFDKECDYVNGASVTSICSLYPEMLPVELRKKKIITSNYFELIDSVDAIYIASSPRTHFDFIMTALEHGKHVICESPITIDSNEIERLFELAVKKELVLMEGNKTAYSTAYWRLILLLKSGIIGDVVSVDATCTSLSESYYNSKIDIDYRWNSIESWGAKCLMTVFQILGCDYLEKSIITHLIERDRMFDTFTKLDFRYPHAVASIKVGKGVKSEGELIISGTNGYVYVPAPWWKTDYFEIRYENPSENRRYFYQLDGEGLRYEIIRFLSAVQTNRIPDNISREVSMAISRIMQDFYEGDFEEI